MNDERRPAFGPGVGSELLHRLVRTFAGVVYLEVSGDGIILEANAAFTGLIGRARGHVLEQHVGRFLTERDAAAVADWAAGEPPPDGACMLNFIGQEGEPVTLRCLVEQRADGLVLVAENEDQENREVAYELVRLNNEWATLSRELARRSRELEASRNELADTLERLESSYWHLKKIQEVLPVCMECGQVKGDEATWQSVVEYLRSNDIFVSHGYCPGCAEAVLEAADRASDRLDEEPRRAPLDQVEGTDDRADSS